MSKLSIYETSWTDLVFENKNKEYGAYILRQENNKTTLLAFFTGLLLLAAAFSLPVLYNHFIPANAITPVTLDLPPAVVVKLEDYPKPKKEPVVAATVVPLSKTPAKENIVIKKQLTNPLIVDTNVDVPELAKNTELENTVATANTNDGTIIKNGGSPSGGTTVIISSGIGDNVILPPLALDKLPEFPGGISKFYNYVGTNFEKPELELERVIKVYISFVVEKDGSMTDIKVLKDPGYGLGKEAIRVLKSIKTKWTPGILDGKAVRTAYNLPITIKID